MMHGRRVALEPGGATRASLCRQRVLPYHGTSITIYYTEACQLTEAASACTEIEARPGAVL